MLRGRGTVGIGLLGSSIGIPFCINGEDLGVSISLMESLRYDRGEASGEDNFLSGLKVGIRKSGLRSEGLAPALRKGDSSL